jgi:hypothetical protein
MIKNYIKVSIRNIKRDKLYSAINILGLAAGITCFLFILSYVAYELSYDRYHEKADRIYRIALSFKCAPHHSIYGIDYRELSCLCSLIVQACSGSKTKEIGIRKMLGATVPEVLFLLWKEFGKLVLVSFAIATPLSYFVMAKWLQDFAYRTPMGTSPFVLSGVLTLVIAMLTVSYYSVRLALSNPADSLRYE